MMINDDHQCLVRTTSGPGIIDTAREDFLFWSPTDLLGKRRKANQDGWIWAPDHHHPPTWPPYSPSYLPPDPPLKTTVDGWILTSRAARRSVANAILPHIFKSEIIIWKNGRNIKPKQSEREQDWIYSTCYWRNWRNSESWENTTIRLKWDRSKHGKTLHFDIWNTFSSKIKNQY